MSHSMVFKAPGPFDIHGHKVAYEVVPDNDVEARLADGWFLTAVAAGEAYQAQQKAAIEAQEQAADDQAAATREEAVAKLVQMGVVFDRRLGTKKLMALVEQTLAERG